MYKIEVYFEHNQICLSISSSNQNLKKWQGTFAQLILDEILIKKFNHGSEFNLCRDHFVTFLQEVSRLYHLAVVHYKVEESLRPLGLLKEKYAIAEIILLHIRMSSKKLTKNNLLAYFLEFFPNYNFLKFYEIIELLEEKFIISKIVSKNEELYFCPNLDVILNCDDNLGLFGVKKSIVKNKVYHI